MWNKLLNIFSDETEKEEISSDNAIAAILVRAAKTDNEYTESERKLIDQLLIKQLNIDLDTATILRNRGRIPTLGREMT